MKESYTMARPRIRKPPVNRGDISGWFGWDSGRVGAVVRVAMMERYGFPRGEPSGGAASARQKSF